METWEPKDPAEKFAASFDFSSEMTTITGATITVQTLRGTDIAPEDVLDGDAQIGGATVFQRVKSGVNKATYKLRCEATDGTEKWVITQALPVLIK